MTLLHLVRRSLVYYWQTNLLVIIGLAIATSVITGSLVVGESMRGSLRDAALARLGGIDQALIASGLFGASLAERLDRQGNVQALLQTQGSAANTESEATVPTVTVWGVTPAFWRMNVSGAGFLVPQDRGVAINAALARDLGVKRDDYLLLTVSRPSALRTDTLFGRKDLQDVTASLRVQITTVLPDNGPGDLRLDAQSARSRNVFIDREWLAAQLECAGQANVLITSTSSVQAVEALQDSLAQAATIADYGLRLKPNPTLHQVALYSDAITLTDQQMHVAKAAARACGVAADGSLIYLATRLKDTTTGHAAAYAIVAGLDSRMGIRFSAGSGAVPSLGGIWLNEWLAADLQAKVGDSLALEYLVPQPDGTYPTQTLRLRVEGITTLAGAGANADLMPDYPGLTDAQTIGNWRPPFPIDMALITPRDEQYWDRYRATPKAFLNLQTVRRMWSRVPQLGTVAAATSVHMNVPRHSDLEAFSREYASQLASALNPQDFDLTFQPVRAQALAASRGTSDFGQLFLGLSMFLVLAGAGLAAMLWRLSVERRTSQSGLLLALGVPLRLVRLALLGEGGTLAVAGALLGMPVGVLYAAGMIGALNVWWQGALGETPALWLHASAESLVTGAMSGIGVGLLAALFSLRGLTSRPTLQLLGGEQMTAEARHSSPAWVIWLLGGVLLSGVILLALAGASRIQPSLAFFGIGFLLLVAVIAGARFALGQVWRHRNLQGGLRSLATRNAGNASGRSLLVIGLLASATFVIVAVAANTRDFGNLDTSRKDSGSGGYTLQATSSVPLTYDLGTPEGRRNLGFSSDDELLLRNCEIVSFLASPGEDISCLNLARPHSPRLLGMPSAFQRSLETGERFHLRTSSQAAFSDAIPCLGDADSVMWTLHSGLGKRYGAEYGGRKVPLVITGLISGSIFARELLVDERDFRSLYPQITAPSYFLIATPPSQTQAVAEALRRTLGELGLQVRPTTEILNEFMQVQNTYLSMFLALGGLGLLLGTLGLIAVISRTILERRAELALMLATGFDRPQLGHLLLLEHMGLLLAGLIAGTLAALVAVAPQLGAAEARVNWPALGAVLAGTLLLGLSTCLVAVRLALRGTLLKALRHE